MFNGGVLNDILFEAATEASEEYLEFLVDILTDSMGPHGEVAAFMFPMSPGDRIAQFTQDAQSGQLDALRDLNPEHYNRRVKQYLEDIKNSPFVARTYEE